MTVLFILCMICSVQLLFSQEEDGVVALSLPIRNSLTFNRFAINPTFSFVREQTKYISLYNKREWVQFDDAPNTYLASYSGRFAENIGAGIGLFQQNYGVLTTFGGVLNFAYNAKFASNSNLTFGLNIGAYKSGINTSNVVTNFDDPSLQNVPENFLLTVNPGINYGIEFFDFGVTLNNLVVYNIQNSTMIEDNPEQGIQGHIMYTGYMDSAGFFDESKFTGLVRSEFRTDETIVSALAMLTVPKGIWAQVGYNSVFGVSGGLGINITPEIAIEYNFERAVGDLTNFGPSHDITLAYRFKNNKRYDYGSEDEIAGLLSGNNKPRKLSKAQIEANKKLAEERKAQIEANRAIAAEERAEREAKLQAKKEAEAKAKIATAEKAKDEEAEAQARLAAEQKAKAEPEELARLVAEQKAKAEAEEQARLAAEQKAKEEAEAQARLAAEQKAKAEAEAQARLAAEQKAKAEAEEQARLAAEQKAKAEAEELARLAEEQKAKEEAEEQARIASEQQAKEEAEEQARFAAEQQAKEALITNPTDKNSKALLELARETDSTKSAQNNLLKQFDDIVEIKNQDLKDLKEENDLSEQGIAVKVRPFKSITEENNRLNKIKFDLDAVIDSRNTKISELMELYDSMFEADTITNSEVYLFYKKKIKDLNTEQAEAIKARAQLNERLEAINVATEFEKRRRIKRAAFDNEEERYAQDRAALQNIKRTTTIGSQTLTVDDFDFGEEQSNNIQILKNIKNIDNGYYLILAVHTDKNKRDEFVKKTYASGLTSVDFFYDVNTSKYYIYYVKFSTIESANEALKSKGNKPYNTNMSLVKIEN